MANLAVLFLVLAKMAVYFIPGIILLVIGEVRPLYIYRWAKYLGMPVLEGERKGQLCRVLVRGKRNSCLIEFRDGYQAVTSRNALRRCK